MPHERVPFAETASTNISAMMERFISLPDLLHLHAGGQPNKLAVADDDAQLSYLELDLLSDRVAASLQREGVEPGDAVVTVSYPSVAQAAVILGTLRAGAVAAPLQPSATPGQLAAMIADSGARVVLLDAAAADALASEAMAVRLVRLDALETWLVDDKQRPKDVEVTPGDAFNIIYSSGTTGVPKGIVLSHGMRWEQQRRNGPNGFATAVTLLATPLYSNTTLVSLLPTLAWGGSAIFMNRFDAHRYLELAQRYRATHTMLVPVQYQRIMTLPDFDSFDLSSFRLKTCTSAPFKPDLKADVVRRWPGALIEYYGMTEGGGSTGLNATEFPDKLHTVGRPLPDHDIRLIDDDGCEVEPGGIGEVVGRSFTMMERYHGREDATRDATWTSPEGLRFVRHGDLGEFDSDGFLILRDRKKDLIISGGFNIYPSDIEGLLLQHPDVADCAVVGVASEQWGETPVGFYVERAESTATADEILSATNAGLGRTQRLSALHRTDELPRSPIGKVLKRELRDRLRAEL